MHRRLLIPALFVLSVLLLVNRGASAAPTTLSPGGIAIIGFNYDNPDEMAFVLLTNIGSGTSITFTDNGWLAAGGFRANEGSFTWTAATDYCAGQVINPAVSGVGFALSGSGDQILAYQGSSGSPSFVYALNSEGAAVWQTDANSSNTSALPTGLTNGSTAVALNEIDNAIYTGTTSGTQAALLAAISNPANWAGSNGTRQTMPGTAFTVTDAAPCGGDVPPTVSSTSPTDGATGVAVDTAVSVTFSESVTFGSNTVAYACDGASGNFTVAPSGGPATWTITPASNLAAGETCTVTIAAADVTDLDGTADNMAADYSWQFTTAAGCGGPATFIHTIQGSGTASSDTGNGRTIEGVVVGDFQGSANLNGFFVQEEDGDADADAATSEGIFVYDSSFGVDVAIGDQVRVTGTVAEFANLTELTSVTDVSVCSAGVTLPAATALSLPFAADVGGVPYLERLEGMLVTVPQGLTVTSIYNLGRGGEFTLSSGGRLFQPTQVAAPGAAANAIQAANDLNQIVVDDGSLTQNPTTVIHPAPALSPNNRVRNGDTLAANLTGVLSYNWSGWSGSDNAYRVYPTGGGATFNSLNPRTAVPASVGSADVKVASFNVLNYFNGNGSGGGFPTARGADTAAEFTRQRDKIIQAIVSLDADVVGLMELENDGYGSLSAIQDLVNGLNAATSAGTYAFINPGVSAIGADAIAVGLIYKPASVTPVGAAAILDSSIDSNFLDTKNRPALAQTFEDNNFERFTVVVNHLKSKGSPCDDGGDPDTGDGQGNCNLTRTAAATAEVNWLAGDPTSSGDPDFLILGDLNSYNMEDPLTAFASGGFINLAEAFGNEYSYTFRGQFGSLDHALGSASLTAQVSGATVWHINADEPPAFDYNDYNQPSLYVADAYRASDHDPVLIGLDFQQQADFSDLAGSYGVAWHTGSGGVRLGAAWDGDTVFAAGSDNSTDDGVSIAAGSGAGGQWQDGVNGGALSINVTGSGNGCLYTWIDWDGDGVFDPNPAGDEYVIQGVTTGSGTYAFDVPAGTFQTPPGPATPVQSYNLRVRLYAACSSGPTGFGAGGEVEDYQVSFTPTAVTLSRLSAQPSPLSTWVWIPILLVMTVMGLGLVVWRKGRFAG